jgi:hypothetical protein
MNATRKSRNRGGTRRGIMGLKNGRTSGGIATA